MFDRLRDFLRTLRTLDEIDAMSDRDLADIGFSRAEMVELATMSAEVPARMARMAALFGLSEAELRADRASYVEAVEVCAHCGAAHRCTREIAEGTATAETVDYCPNAPLYGDLAARRG
jgi:uncharacterized protein YjiS (DUF1127 family)